MDLNVLSVSAGTAPTFAAPDVSLTDTFAGVSGNKCFVVYKNTNAATRTVTIAIPGDLESGDAYPDKEYTLGATTGELWIPLIARYVDSSTGLVSITVSASAGVTASYVRIP